MTPTPAECSPTSSECSDDICVTGIAGSFPNSRSVKHLADNLFNKVDLISDDERRWKKQHPEIPQRTGKIYDVQKFDAEFFGYHFKKAHTMNPLGRILLERVYECLIDAGVNPTELRDTNTGVFMGACISESEKEWTYEKFEITDNKCRGAFHSLVANNVSEWLGLKGPSYTVDTACSSSLFALDHAYKSLRDGHCDNAIVGGLNLCLHPSMSLLFYRMGILSDDGRCKSFDNRANGYARSESIVACFLQRAKDSRRVYAKLVHTKTNCDGYKVQGITYPAGHIQKQLLEKFYVECGIAPSSIEFMEAHGTGTNVGDPEELGAIDDIFCKDRKEPLMIGSVKSNLGHSEASSGMNSLAKACIAYNTGYIPPNINFESPREECPSLMEGRLKVVTEKQPWNRGRFALSSFGFGGANAHILLENWQKPKLNNGLPNDEIPRLVCVSGRTESAVSKILDDLASRPVDQDLVRLWHAIHERNIPGHDFRGFVLLDSTSSKSISLKRHIESISDAPKKHQICFRYTDLRTQWPEVAKQCLILPVFARAVQKCAAVLKSKDIDLIQLFHEDASKQKEEAIIGATAVNIGLTDVLKATGIKPDYANCYDIGELCSAYAEERLSAEETILAAYKISLTIKKTLANVSVLKIKLDYQSVVKICPTDTYIECDKPTNSCVIVAPTTVIHKVTKILGEKGVPHENLGFHNAVFYRYLTESVKDNIKKPVNKRARFNVVDSAIIIEIGFSDDLDTNEKPKKKNEIEISLLKQNVNHVESVLTALGKIFVEGLNPALANIYPPVPFPVAQGTPMMSHLVEWDHTSDWVVGDFSEFFTRKIPFGQKVVQFYMVDDQHDYLKGHTIDDRVIFPATGYIRLAWEAYADMSHRIYTDVSVVFEDVYLNRATNLPKDGILEFTVTIHESGKFEIVENKTPVVTGRIREMNNAEDKTNSVLKALKQRKNEDSQNIMMNSKDFYKELNIRGYQYKGVFRGVKRCSVDGRFGMLAWEDNWISFLDTMLQVKIVSQDTRALYVPTRIERILIDTDKHKQLLAELGTTEDQMLEFESIPEIDMTRAGGAEVRGIHVASINKKPPRGIPVLEKNLFVANFCRNNMALPDILRCNLQLIHENIQTYKFKNIELVDEEYQNNDIQPISVEVADILADLPLVQAEMLVLGNEQLTMPANITVANKKISGESNAVLFIGANLLQRQTVLKEALATLKNDCFVLSREKEFQFEQEHPYDIITVYYTETEHFVLLRNKTKPKPTKYLKINNNDLMFSWIEDVKKELLKEQQKLVLYSEGEPINGLLGLVNCLRKEPGGEMVRGLLIADPTAPKFSADCKFYKEHLDKGLGINVFKNGQWGTYRHLVLEDLATIPAAHAYANTATVGDLNSLTYWEGRYSQNPNPDSVTLVHAYSASLNFRDAMIALGRVTVDAVARGRINQDCVQGIEIAGRTSNGARVMGVCAKGLSNLVEVIPTLFIPIPDEWSFQEATTVPVAYMTVYMALNLIGKVRRGERILIHAGSGGVGQAAISVALHQGLEVFTTVGTSAKRAFIKRLFPQIKDSHIGNSRDTSFEHMIRRETNGEGVDVVLNSLADEKLQASVKCLRRCGRFLEIGKYDITMNTQLEMCFQQKEISFHSIMLDYVNDDCMEHVRMDLAAMVLNGIQSGAVRPLTSCTFEKYELQTAYRYMAAGKHIGKVVMKIREEEPVSGNVQPKPELIDAVPRYMCSEHHVYVLVGGLGGFGIELADWLVLRGARKILLCSRKGLSKGYQHLRIRIWQSYGAQVEICTSDVTTESGCQDMLKMAASMGPVQAIFNLAVVLNDAVFQNQTPTTFQNSYGPKALTTIYLDKWSRVYCPDLKDFVIFSSVSCGRGNAGQTNYGFSNSVMERICEERKKDGLPAVAIQWGAIGDVGLVADMQEENVQLEIGGTLQQRISSCLQVLDKFLKQDVTIVSSIVVAEKRAANSGVDSIMEVVAHILGISDLKSISQQAPLSEMGMDSVMAVEIKQTLERDYELFLTAQEIRLLTFAKLTELASKDSSAEVTKSNQPAEDSTEVAAAGLALFVKNFGDETLASKPYIIMDSKEKLASLGNRRGTLFMLPGLESCASTFELLCSKINAKTCVLQLGLNYNDTLEQTVNNLYKTMKSLLKPGAPFSLLGYSFGTIPVLKLAAKLESAGHKGTVICLDGAPAYLKCMVKEFLKSSDDRELENAIICHSFSAVCPGYNTNQILSKKLKELERIEDKIKYALEMAPTKPTYSDEFMFTMAKVTYSRIKMVSDMDLNAVDKINSPITLLRAKQVVMNLDCNELYGLDKFTDKKIDVHCIDASHSNIIDNEECANIINRILSETNFTEKFVVRPAGGKNI
ncbi:KR domain-containing protein [Phthorimaea operculella]|nr:KR domain-containing protein [Phthorimaea operculella]